MNRPKVALVTFGCQMNKLDSEIAEAGLLREGFVLVDDPAEADAVLFNTCAVRAHAEERVVSRLAALYPLQDERPGLVLGILGCMAQEHGASFLDRYPRVSLVAGTSHFHQLGRLLQRALAGERIAALQGGRDPGSRERDPEAVPVGPRAFVAVQRGCSMGCAYCIVPSVRGPWRSRPLEEVLEECRRVLGGGAADLTLLGQTVDAWGRDLSPRRSFAALLRAVHDLPGLKRLHFVTSHPLFLDGETASLFGELPRLARWVHLPPQSGSDRVLRAMRRGYTRKKYLETVELLRRADPGVEIAGDFICGFPGETEEDHRATLSLLEEVRFSQCYVFKYSPRPGTPAASLAPLPPEVVRRRHAEVLSLHEKIAARRNKALVGTVQEVLLEGPSPKDPGRLTGRTVHHRIVHFPGRGDERPGDLVRVRILEASPVSLVGAREEED